MPPISEMASAGTSNTLHPTLSGEWCRLMASRGSRRRAGAHRIHPTHKLMNESDTRDVARKESRWHQSAREQKASQEPI